MEEPINADTGKISSLSCKFTEKLLQYKCILFNVLISD